MTTYNSLTEAIAAGRNKRKARGRITRRTPGVMNKLESKWSEHLRLEQQAGRVVDFWFETHKYRLADKTWYTPDFVVLNADGSIHVHEVKGFWEDDARVKIKVFAEKFFMYEVFAVSRKGWQWVMESFQ